MGSFKAWVTMQEFKDLSSSKRVSGLSSIYKKYFSEGGEYYIKPDTNIKNISEAVQSNSDNIPVNILQDVQNECFLRIYSEIFGKFKKTERFNRIAHDRVKMYNRINPDDFDWMQILGEGGFGKVVRVRKKTTGKMYAMKVQAKHLILESSHGDAKTVRMERDILAESDSPFICELHYAFQTKKQVLLALELMTGDVSQIRKSGQEGVLEENIAKFWMAQVYIAVKYLHDSGYEIFMICCNFFM